MKTRLLFSAVGIPILLILLIVLPDWGTLIFCAVLAGIAAHEMICAVGDGGRFPIYGAIFGFATCRKDMLPTCMAYQKARDASPKFNRN